MSAKSPTFAEAVLGFILLVFVMRPIGWLVTGWAASTLWNWFAVPALGVPALSIPSATGLAFVVAAYRGVDSDSEKAKADGFVDAVGRLIGTWVGLLILVVLGWVFRAVAL